ncbi:hypothetical protein BHM03_00010538 [Ensete ventricosum]|nr:hypothetical protein BHM03_00010538 [Ensete ventricosum]
MPVSAVRPIERSGRPALVSEREAGKRDLFKRKYKGRLRRSICRGTYVPWRLAPLHSLRRQAASRETADALYVIACRRASVPNRFVGPPLHSFGRGTPLTHADKL